LPDSEANGERGSTDDLPWASVFDPAANARALSAIQAEGFRAASQIVDRFIRIVTPEAGAEGGGGTPEQLVTSAAGANVVSDLETLTRSWWSMVGRMLLQSAPNAGNGSGDATTLDLVNAESTGQIDLAANVGGSASTEVWLHNRSADDLGEIALRCSDLLSSDGHLFQTESIRLEPAIVPMPARSSRGIAMNIHVAEYVRPGLYRGTLLVEGHPKLWLPVGLVVSMPSA
jgi:hypothetical protein